MTPLECPQIDDLLDLYVAGECDDASQEAVDRHVAGCSRCQAELSHAREVAGLLDLHFREDQGLARLERQLRQHVHLHVPAWRRPEVTRPLLALAAMLLVTFGLGLWLSPGQHRDVGDGPLLVALEKTPDRDQAIPAAVRGHELAMPPAAKKAVVLDIGLEGKSPAEWLKAVRAGVKEGRLPLPPRVPLSILLRNPGAEPLHVEVGGESFACRLELSGPQVFRLAAGPKAPPPVAPLEVTIPPGGEVGLPWERLEAVEAGQVEYLYPLAPGEYRLTVAVRAVAWKEGQRPRAVWHPASEPIALRLDAKR